MWLRRRGLQVGRLPKGFQRGDGKSAKDEDWANGWGRGAGFSGEYRMARERATKGNEELA
jgi:hypothetical protein